MDWNRRYQECDTPWDKGMATPVLEEVWLRPGAGIAGEVVVPGCGLGHDARWLAERGCKVTGLDLSPLAVEQARVLDRNDSVTFEVADLLHPSSGLLGRFDWLWEHTCFCALDPGLRQGYVHSARALLRPAGRVAGVFFTDPALGKDGSGPPFGMEASALQTLWREGGFEVLDAWTPATGYEERIGREWAMILEKRR